MKKMIRRTALLLAATMFALLVGAYSNSPAADQQPKFVKTACAATNCCSGAHTIVSEGSSTRAYKDYPNLAVPLSDGRTGYGIWHQKVIIRVKRFYCSTCGKEISYSSSVEEVIDSGWFEYYWWSPRDPLGTPFAMGIRG